MLLAMPVARVKFIMLPNVSKSWLTSQLEQYNASKNLKYFIPTLAGKYKDKCDRSQSRDTIF